MIFKHILFIAFLLLAVVACQQDAEKQILDESSTGKQEPADHPDGLILIDRAQVEVAGIQWGAINTVAAPDGQQLFGEWVLHPEYTAQVHSIAAGRVVRIHYATNQSVGKGAVLIDVESPELIDLQREYLEKKARSVYLEQELTRMKTLEEGGATALKNLQAAESAVRYIRASLSGLKADLALYGIDGERLTPESLTGRYPIRAPQAGRITHSAVAVGQWLEPGTPICDIRDLQHIHGDLFAYPAQMPSLKVGNRLAVENGSPGGRPLYVKVVSLDKSLDPEKKALRIHTRVEGPLPEDVVEGGYLSARLSWTDEPAGLILPAASVRKEGGTSFVLVLDESHSTPEAVAFRKVDVDVIREDNQRVVVREGVIRGDEIIVLEGAYYVHAQSQVAEFGEEE